MEKSQAERNTQSENLSAEQVIQYLSTHPDFFERHPNALTQLSLSHPSGNAISLIERQVSVLRQRNTELRNKLNELLNNARENDRLFERTKRLVLALVECHELGDILDALLYSFDKEFQIEQTRIILFTDIPQPCNARCISLDTARYALGRHLKSTRNCNSHLTQEEIDFLFGRDAPYIGSAALALFGMPSAFGALAVGNANPSYYQNGMGTLFLGHIAEVVGRLIGQHLQK